MTPPTIDWTAQQEAARQRSIAAGGELGLALELPGAGGALRIVGTVVRLATGEHGQEVAILFTDRTPGAETRIDVFVALQTQE